MLKELLESELTRLSVEITNEEAQLTEVMASGCGRAFICGGSKSSGGDKCNLS